MICPFCSQRNPRGTRRCLFCDNPPDAPDDVSATWPPPGLRALPGSVQEGHIERVRQAHRKESKRQGRLESLITIGVLAFVVLMSLLQHFICGSGAR